MTQCPSCGRENPEDARFCNSCGAALAAEQAPPREERKIVTVLFADLVGFTSRAEKMDPEDVRALLAPYHARLRSELERYGGTVEKFIGDAVMALFGAPVAHEDDPERAVRAALAIRDWVKEQEEELQLRIAVNTGKALISLGARPEQGEGMASGDVVNTTARLQSAAPVNGILVGESTFRATRDVIDYERADPVEAKGKAEPIPVWVASQARSRFGVDVIQESRTPLVGRAHELDLLRETLARARREPSVQLVTLVGVPGMGKSRLVYELMQSVRAIGELVTWRQGRSLPYGEGVSLWALGEMVKAQAGILETDGDDEVVAKIADSARGIVDASESGWVERHLRTLLGLADEHGERAESFAAWRRYLEALADQRPLVLVFEDLHWADDGLLDFVDHLVEWATDVPLLVVGTARPELLERRPGWGGGKRNATTLSLAPLGELDAARLIAELLGRSVLPAETQSALLERAEGNPLYAEQYVRMLAERVGDADLALPETVQGIIAARLDGLAPEEKDVLQNASVLGKVFWTGALEAVGGIDRRQAEEVLHALDRKEFVRRERRPSLAGEQEYVFRHVLVRDVAYSQIPRSTRLDKHVRAADWIDSLGRPDDHAEMLAHHYGAALELARAAKASFDAIEAPARRAFESAGNRAQRLNAFSAAAHFYARALELGGVPRENARLLALRGRALLVTSASDAIPTLEHARDALLACGERAAAADVEADLAEACWWRADERRVLEHIEAAQALVTDAEPSLAKTWVLAKVARHRLLSGDIQGGDRIGSDAVESAAALGSLEAEAFARLYRGIARAALGDAQGAADLERSLELAERAGALDTVHRAHGALSVEAYELGDMVRGADHAERGMEVALRLGAPQRIGYSRNQRLWFLFDGGRWDEFEALLEEIVAEEGGENAALLSMRGAVRLASGDTTRALADLRAAVPAARAVAEPQTLVPTLSLVARGLAELGARAEAKALTDDLLDNPHAHEAPAYSYYHVAFVAHELGRGSELGGVLDRVHRVTPWIEATKAILAEDYESAAEIFAGMNVRPQEADARRLAAAKLFRQGRAAEADDQLRNALAFYRSVGASRYIAEGEQLLAAAG